MGVPAILWNETAALDQLAAMLRFACPEIPAKDIYRAQPGASPGKFGSGGSIVILPLTPVPELRSPHGSESTSPQAQRWRVRVTTAAAGVWSATVLGQAAPYAAGPGDTPAVIRDGLRAAVDALGLPVTTSVPATPPAAFDITAQASGQSLGVSVTAPVGGTFALTVEDDNLRRAVYNWGLYRVRLIFRDIPSTTPMPTSGVRYTSAILAERVRLYLQATSLPTTNGLAYPYVRDLLQAPAGRLSWRQTFPPISVSEAENNMWVRVVALDVEFETPVALTHDVPSLDALGLAQDVVPSEV